MSELHVFILLAVFAWVLGAILALFDGPARPVSKFVTFLLFLGLIFWGVGVLVA